MSIPHINTTKWKDFTKSDVFNGVFLSKILPEYVQSCRWFGAKNTPVRHYNAELIVPMESDSHVYFLIIIEVVFETAYSENYQLILGRTEANTKLPDNAKIAELSADDDSWLVVDALYLDHFRSYLFDNVQAAQVLTHPEGGNLIFEKGSLFDEVKVEEVTSEVLNAEQSNTTVVFNDAYYLKIYRKLFRDANPDYELTYFLSEQTGFSNSPRFAGSLTWKKGAFQVTLGLMQAKIENEGDAWTHFLKVVYNFYNRLDTNKTDISRIHGPALYEPIPPERLDLNLQAAMEVSTMDAVQKLAQRTAEMHLALFKEKFTQRFVPKAFNTDYKAWLLNRLIYSIDQRYHLLENTIHKLEGQALEYANEFLQHKHLIKDKILNFHSSQLNSMRIRIHGDYHLGQVIMAGDDFYILDFEGEPEATIRDRKVKQPPMKDVAGMLRSFQYAIYAVIFDDNNKLGMTREQQFEIGEKYYAALVGIFLDRYIEVAFRNGLDIGYRQEIDFLLRYHLLEKAIYEMGYELNSRPDWVVIPLKGVLDIIKHYKNGQ